MADHIAILVPSVQRASDYLSQFSFDMGKAQEFPSEGTKEIYVDYGKENSLLLMEPLASGPYRRALEKRGPGLHHIAINVLKLENFMTSIAGSGWLLHPISVKTMAESKTAYLARPGFPGLIEVQEKPELVKKDVFISELTIKMDHSMNRLFLPVGIDSFVKNSNDDESIIAQGKKIQLKKLWL